MRKRLLIVDDEPSIRRVLAAHLQRAGHEVETAADGAAAIAALQARPFHAVVTDLRMPEVDGMALLEWIRRERPGLPTVLITAHGTVDSAVEAIKAGAFDYITKPFDAEELKQVLERALRVEEVAGRTLGDAPGRHDIIGRTRAMEAIFATIDKVAASPSTVLITGESGTGKELVARAIHRASDRASGPFISVNCAAIPENLFESELFGHERGAFTGAVQARPGRFELADGGTLFLDEVGEMPLDMQVKLLRVLQERTFERVGGTRPLRVDVRLVAATNRDLADAVRSGAFRDDLYWRLNVIPIHIPPLRERREDVPLLVEHFLARFREVLHRDVRGVSPEAMQMLVDWHWPGNIRELENVLERAVLLCEGDTITPADLPGLGPAAAPPGPEGATVEQVGLKEMVRLYTARLERTWIQEALEAEGHNVTRAARRLGISRKSLQVKMKEYGLRDG